MLQSFKRVPYALLFPFLRLLSSPAARKFIAYVFGIFAIFFASAHPMLVATLAYIVPLTATYIASENIYDMMRFFRFYLFHPSLYSAPILPLDPEAGPPTNDEISSAFQSQNHD